MTKSLATNILHLLWRNGWTVRELAVRSGVHANTINNYLRGNNEPTLRRLRRLRDAFGCTWDELLGD